MQNIVDNTVHANEATLFHSCHVIRILNGANIVLTIVVLQAHSVVHNNINRRGRPHLYASRTPLTVIVQHTAWCLRFVPVLGCFFSDWSVFVFLIHDYQLGIINSPISAPLSLSAATSEHLHWKSRTSCILNVLLHFALPYLKLWFRVQHIGLVMVKSSR